MLMRLLSRFFGTPNASRRVNNHEGSCFGAVLVEKRLVWTGLR